MEPFVRHIVAGGVGMLAGLWLVVGFDRWAPPWLVGLVLVAGGGAYLLHGIAEPLEY